jgi:hypothetical protein
MFQLIYLKHTTLATIYGGVIPHEESFNIAKLMRADVVPKSSKRSILGFRCQMVVDDTPNEELPLLILVIITNYDIFQILTDEGSSCDIMYEELFHKLKLKLEQMRSLAGGLLTMFNESFNQTLGTIALPTAFREGKTSTSRRTIQVKLLQVKLLPVPFKTTLASLGAVS